MGRALGHTAATLACSERTLRRYINEGILRGRTLEAHRFDLPETETVYLHRHWPLLRGLRTALRTERSVRLAVLFGSMATGEDTERSDIDLLVVLDRDDESAFAGLRRRLQDGLGRPIHLVRLDDGQRSPSLLADVLDEGRVLIDRDEKWPGLQAQRDRIIALALQDDANVLAFAHASVDALHERVGR
jgi:predicted nucleotidyltransferase